MTLALHPELPSNLLTDLIVSDIAPVRAKVSEDTVQHIRAMERIEEGSIYTRKEADEILSEHEKVPLTMFVPSNKHNSSRIRTSEHSCLRTSRLRRGCLSNSRFPLTF
jgi:hypothetical protein